MEKNRRNGEQGLFPKRSPEGPRSSDQEQRQTMTAENWYALRVRSRHEFVAAEELARKGVENFLPFVSRVNQWKDRKKTVDVPLFPGYLFVRIAPGPGAFLNIVKTRGSVCLVSLEPGRPTAVSAEELSALKSMLESGEPLDVFPAFKEGAAVRVKRGPLCGVVGVLVQRAGGNLFLINIDILGRSVGLKIRAEDVEKP